ncbi:chemotaxis protein CheY-like protein [Bacteriovorax sp. BSW11_IV]|uniref:response regulator n=1 Tax=Bacteriovorax sp. BSW11_IV TaxID=1353529 RepID=UPI000389F8F2|nr:response regulator [Bacteriovorax sp. BSW11_IV]EQC46426.1 chemotaxis protein CheY-like protein [Bacteriovorax sp. BSW11_IV]
MTVSAALRILIVDDCIDTRNFIKQILLKKGFKNIVSATNGDEALQILNESYKAFTPIGLILADREMPVLDGMQFLSKVRLDPRYNEVPFIMVTADNEKDHVVEALSVGVTNYIVKPIRGDVLLNKMVETLERKVS